MAEDAAGVGQHVDARVRGVQLGGETAHLGQRYVVGEVVRDTEFGGDPRVFSGDRSTISTCSPCATSWRAAAAPIPSLAW
jgi:hypothetical protein